jgi:hypothetical protein
MAYTDQDTKKLIRLVLSKDIQSTRDLIQHGLMTEEEYQSHLQRLVNLIAPTDQNDSQYNHLLIVLGSPPASGKTTLKELLFGKTPLRNAAAIINTDIMRQQSEEYQIIRNLKPTDSVVQELCLSAEDLEFLRKAARSIFILPDKEAFISAAMKRYSAMGVPIIIESHLDEIEEARNITAFAEHSGYKTLLLSPDVDIPTFFERETSREAKTGKAFIIESDLKRNVLFEQHWPEFLTLFNVVCRVDNNHPIPTIIAIAEDGVLHIMDEVAYGRARQKTRINIQAHTAEEALHYTTPSQHFGADNANGLEERAASRGQSELARVVASENKITQSIIDIFRA